MDRRFYLDLAESGLRMPIGADLVLHEKEDVEAIKCDGKRLGAIIEETARRFNTPLAIPLMDLMLEKQTLLNMLDVPADQIPTWHFSSCPAPEILETVDRRIMEPYGPRLKANVDAVSYIAKETDLLPVAMSIGPFSLMTKLLSDPITPVYESGTGMSARDSPEICTVERALEMSIRVILQSITAQLEVGAKAVMIAEPAANRVFFSPKQLAKGSDIFERYVMVYNRRIRQLCREYDADLLFHCCGELVEDMVRNFASLDSAVLSLGSSRVLWEDTALVPPTTVLYGNLPSKSFYSDEIITIQQVEEKACELITRMKQANHPFILGSECDVLSVPGCQSMIMSKVEAFVNCSC